jgi:hypothetical protein
MAKVQNDTKVVTGKVRFSYVHVFEPFSMNADQEPKYSICLLIPKSDKETLRKIKAAVEAVKKTGTAKWGGKIPPNLKTPLRDGDVDRPDQEEYAGMYFLNASTKQKPGVVDAQLNPILDPTEVYSGCYGRASINFFAYNTAGNKGIGCGLNHIQKLEDGDYLGGRTRPEDDFEAFGDAGGEEEDFLG